MIQAAALTLEINGRAATAGELRALALGGYGHFTAMQLRGGRTRGLQLHLDRLNAASKEMFGTALEGSRVRDLIRHALGARVRDASVRVIVQQPVEQEPPWVMQLVQARLMLPQRHSPVRVADLGSFGAVFITNSHGVAAVTQVDDRRLSVDTALISMLKDCYESVPWEEV